MFFDPLYLAVMGIGLLLSLGAQAWVMGAVKRWKQVPIGHGMAGADVARLILETEGIHDVRIEETPGTLSDHYDPRNKVLRLSPDHFRGASVAAAGIAAHEVGHAIQDKVGYGAMRLRQLMVPVANIGTNLGIIMVMIGLGIGATGLAKVGVLLFAGFVFFTLVTLPVEIDASRRAYAALSSSGVLTRQELGGVKQVLSAAAATYVAAALTAILQLLYFAYRAGLLGNRRDD
jgi:Zn-dependent membrane protease YugP